jgi:hypothetical protein
MTKITYAQYLDLRYGKNAQHALMPRSVSDISREAEYIGSGKAAANAARKAAFGLDFDYTDRIEPYGGYVSDLTLDADEVRALGFDPEHLTAKVTLSYDDFFETPADLLDGAGYDFDKRRDGRSGYGWEHDENEDRPTHESVLVDYSGPRERSDWRWVTLREREQRYFFTGNAWSGMSRGVRAQVRHERLLELNANMADYAAKWCADDIKNFTVEVTVYWRGEEVGSSSLGGCEMDDARSSRAIADEVADFLLDNALVGEALDEAVEWADDAVLDAQKRAASIVEGIALLPERSVAAVRDAFTTAKVIKAKRA